MKRGVHKITLIKSLQDTINMTRVADWKPVILKYGRAKPNGTSNMIFTEITDYSDSDYTDCSLTLGSEYVEITFEGDKSGSRYLVPIEATSGLAILASVVRELL